MSNAVGLSPAALASLCCRAATCGAPSSEDEVCAICLDGISDGELLTELACSHAFHKTCVTRWLAVSPLCPLCKTHALDGPGLPHAVSDCGSIPSPRQHQQSETRPLSHPAPSRPPEQQQHPASPTPEATNSRSSAEQQRRPAVSPSILARGGCAFSITCDSVTHTSSPSRAASSPKHPLRRTATASSSSAPSSAPRRVATHHPASSREADATTKPSAVADATPSPRVLVSRRPPPAPTSSSMRSSGGGAAAARAARKSPRTVGANAPEPTPRRAPDAAPSRPSPAARAVKAATSCRRVPSAAGGTSASTEPSSRGAPQAARMRTGAFIPVATHDFDFSHTACGA